VVIRPLRQGTSGSAAARLGGSRPPGDHGRAASARDATSPHAARAVRTSSAARFRPGGRPPGNLGCQPGARFRSPYEYPASTRHGWLGAAGSPPYRVITARKEIVGDEKDRVKARCYWRMGLQELRKLRRQRGRRPDGAGRPGPATARAHAAIHDAERGRRGSRRGRWAAWFYVAATTRRSAGTPGRKSTTAAGGAVDPTFGPVNVDPTHIKSARGRRLRRT